MIKKVFVCIFIFQLISTNYIAQASQQIQIFDVHKGKVVKTVQMNTHFQQEAEKFLHGITGVYVKHNPIPDEGIMVRIPLEPNIMVKNQWFDDLVDELTIIFPVQEKPYFMVFDDENKPYFFTFKSNTSKLLKLLDFKLKSS